MKLYNLTLIAGYVIISGLFFYSCLRESLSDKTVSYVADPKNQYIDLYYEFAITKPLKDQSFL